MASRVGKVVILAGPSGSGKTTIERALLKELPNSSHPISVTTRPPRENEVNGQDYYFVSRDEFAELVMKGAFFEWAEVYNNFYGTLRKEIEGKRQAFQFLICTLDIQGAMVYLKKIPEAVSIFIMPPSDDELTKRNRERGSGFKVDDCRRKAIPAEITASKLFHYVVFNDHIHRCVAEIKRIIGEHFKEAES